MCALLTLGLSAATAVGLASAGALALRAQAAQLPDLRPQTFLARPEESRTARHVVVCLGDSITHGRVSGDYTAELERRLGREAYETVNAGINGDLAWNALQRLDEVVACRPRAITVLLGTNDAIASLSASRSRAYVRGKKLPQPPDAAWFRRCFEQLLDRLTASTSARIVVGTLPPLGEAPEHPAFRRAAEYSTIVAACAEERNLSWIDVNGALSARISAERGSRASAPARFERSDYLVAKAVIQHYLLGRSFDRIAASNGFRMLSDAIHLSDRAAVTVAEMFARALLAAP